MSSTVDDHISDLNRGVAEGHWVFLEKTHCRASFGEGRVCGLLSDRCNRTGHRDLPKLPVGYYRNLGGLRATSRNPDGAAGTHVDPHPSEADYFQEKLALS